MADGLSVDGQGHTADRRVRVGLEDRLHVDSLTRPTAWRWCGGSWNPALHSGPLDSREPDLVAPVGVVEGRPVVGGEDEAVGLGSGQPFGNEVLGEEIHQPDRQGQRPQTGSWVRRSVGRPLLSDAHGAAKEVDVADAQPCYLALAKSEQSADPDNGRLTHPHSLCELRNGGQLAAA